MKYLFSLFMLLASTASLSHDFEISLDPDVYDDRYRDYGFMYRSKTKECNTIALDNIMNPKIFFGGLAMGDTKDNFISSFKYCEPINGDESKVVAVMEAITGPAVDQYRFVDPRQALSLNNLRGIRDLNDLKAIQAEWAGFWRQFAEGSKAKKPTLAEVFRFAHHIDKTYGHKFIPPVTLGKRMH